jgi:DNA-damage-inducible protein J
MKTTMVHARVDENVKKESEAVLKHLGLSISKAIGLFLRQVSLHKGLPFPLEIPSEETLKAMKDVESGRNLIEISSDEFDKIVDECVK